MARRRRQSRLESSEAVDRISNLSDEVICHILSFVPTKSAVKTSILAKRWKYIWKKVPVLDFMELPPLKDGKSLTTQQNVNFTSFVDRVLFHNNASSILRLCLKLYKVHDDSNVSSWMGAIMKREIREIVIFSQREKAIPFPMGSLSCDCLVVLKLAGVFSIDVPENLHLPNLEILQLCCSSFSGEECLKKLLLGCPVLKELVIREFYGNLYVESSSLEELHIERRFLEDSKRVVIEAPRLTYLHLLDALKQYDICDLSLLVEANLDLYGLDNCSCALEILNKASGVNTMGLGESTRRLFTDLSEPPTFWNLTHLQLDEVDESVYKIFESAPSLKFLSLIRVCRDEDSDVLENLYGSDLVDDSPETESDSVDDSPETETEPETESEAECLQHLENVEMSCFKGEDMETKFVAYCLKVAPVLKEIKINVDTAGMDKKKERDVVQKLMKLPRTSAACQVTLSFDSPDFSEHQRRECKVLYLWPY